MTDVRITNSALTVMYVPARPDVRVTNSALQVMYEPARPSVRITNSALQVMFIPGHVPIEEVEPLRVTQSASLTLTAADPDLRVTQSTAQVMAGLESDLRVTRSTAQVMATIPSVLRVSSSIALVLADQTPCVTYYIQTWTITRKDGQVFAFTSHVSDFLFKGIVHKACNSLSASATESSTIPSSTGNMDMAGVVSDDSITDADLYNGLFDGAEVEVWVVPWKNPDNETAMRVLHGTIGKVEHGDNQFRAEIITPSATIQQRPLLETYSPGCRFKLGDERCKIDLSALEVSGSVTGLAIPTCPNSSERRVFADSSRTEVNGFFDFGEVTWVTGDNAGLSVEVKSNTDGTFILWKPLPNPIQLGDQYTMRPGCDLSAETCKTKFNNFDNFGGFPHVPGEDKAFQTPNAH